MKTGTVQLAEMALFSVSVNIRARKRFGGLLVLEHGCGPLLLLGTTDDNNPIASATNTQIPMDSQSSSVVGIRNQPGSISALSALRVKLRV